MGTLTIVKIRPLCVLTTLFLLVGPIISIDGMHVVNSSTKALFLRSGGNRKQECNCDWDWECYDVCCGTPEPCYTSAPETCPTPEPCPTATVPFCETPEPCATQEPCWCPTCPPIETCGTPEPCPDCPTSEPCFTEEPCMCTCPPPDPCPTQEPCLSCPTATPCPTPPITTFPTCPTCPPASDGNPKFSKTIYQSSLPSWPIAGTTVHLGIDASTEDGAPVSYQLLTSFEFMTLSSTNEIVFTSNVSDGAFVGPNNVMVIEVVAAVIGDESRTDSSVIVLVFPRSNTEENSQFA